MLRRVHTANLTAGEIALDPAASRHARDVLRLSQGTQVEVFDDAGHVGMGAIISLSPQVIVRITTIAPAPIDRMFKLTIASAVPKGERADWMIEKLSELGCWRFVPLATDRSVVLPEGRNKHQRWIRIATEAAKQSRRHGVMQITNLTPLKDALVAGERTFHLSTQPGVLPLPELLAMDPSTPLTLLVGPEGGWSDEEIELFASAQAPGVSLTSTVLRVETAAICAAAVVMTTAALVAASNRADEP